MEEIYIPIARNLRNDRPDGLRHLLFTELEKPKSHYLDARRLTLDVSSLESPEELPSIQEMLDRWSPASR